MTQVIKSAGAFSKCCFGRCTSLRHEAGTFSQLWPTFATHQLSREMGCNGYQVMMLGKWRAWCAVRGYDQRAPHSSKPHSGRLLDIVHVVELISIVSHA